MIELIAEQVSPQINLVSNRSHGGKSLKDVDIQHCYSAVLTSSTEMRTFMSSSLAVLIAIFFTGKLSVRSMRTYLSVLLTRIAPRPC